MKTIKANGRTYRIKTLRDDCAGAPWENDEGCGIVSEWTTRDKRAGELILSSDRSSRRYYDFAATVEKAKADGWGIAGSEDMTRGQIAEAAARADYERLRAWCNDEWGYVGVCVTDITTDPCAPDDFTFAVWGIESDDEAGQAEIVADLIEQQRETANERNYIASEAAAVMPEGVHHAYPLRVVVSSEFGITKHLNITPEQAHAIFAIIA